MTNSIREIRDADCIFVTGSNTAEAHPVLSYEMIRAVRRGANLIVLDPRHVPLVDHATLFLQAKPGTDIYVLLAIMHVIVREGWEDKAFIDAYTEGCDAFAEVLEAYTPDRASLMSGVPAEDIEEAARLYAHGARAAGKSAYSSEDQDERGHSGIFYAMGITQRSNGTDLVMTLANLAMLCGQVGKPSTGVNPLRGQANVQGACDLGGLVNVLPGYQAVTDDEKRQNVAKQWGAEDLPAEVGLTIVEAMHAAAEGKVRAMYVMGENPMLSDPNLGHVEEALRSLDFLLVQDLFLCETALLAHMVLPAAASLEKSGTFTNTERRVQILSPVIEAPDGALPDWEIIARLAAKMDEKLGIQRKRGYWQYASPAEIMDEIAEVTPIYGGISYSRLAGAGLQWPCPDKAHPGTRYLHKGGNFARGKGKFNAVTAKDPAEQPDDDYPLILTTGRVLYHYHTGTMTRRSEPLDWAEPGGFVEINQEDAAAAGVEDGEAVLVQSRRGTVRATTRISDGVQPGTVFMAFHWRESPANLLTQDHTLDPVAKIPEYKICAVRLEKPNGA